MTKVNVTRWLLRRKGKRLGERYTIGTLIAETRWEAKLEAARRWGGLPEDYSALPEFG